jgi:hypothetical protein
MKSMRATPRSASAAYNAADTRSISVTVASGMRAGHSKSVSSATYLA